MRRHRRIRADAVGRKFEAPDGDAIDLFTPIVAEDLTLLNNDIRNRGGDLVLVRMPTSGPILKREQACFPRAKFWDTITPKAGIPSIHFQDDPVLSGFSCPDYSHLDAVDVPIFTARLADIIKSKVQIGTF